jgi:hypothetical protein
MVKRKPELPWENNRPTWMGALITIAGIAVLVAGVLIVQALSNAFP